MRGIRNRRPSPGVKAFLASVILSWLWACAAPQPAAQPANYYLSPPLTYLRDAPNFGGNVLAQLYRGEMVERLDIREEEGGWWRVRSPRTGQTGWVPGELLSPTPVPVSYLYVAVTSVPLRECPEAACLTLQLLYGGDRVQELEADSRGWVRVLVDKGRTLGWLPRGVLAEKPAAAQPPRPRKPYAYVAVPRLRMRINPNLQAPVVRSLALNDQVERLEANPAGWLKVRHPASGAVGWVQARFLDPLPTAAPPRGKKKPRAPERKEEEPPPEIM